MGWPRNSRERAAYARKTRLSWLVLLIVVSGLEEIDRLIGNAVHQTVFLSDSPGPTTAEHIFQRFGLSGAFERFPHDSINEIEDPQCNRPLILNPKAEILKKLGLKYCDPFTLRFHRVSVFLKLRSFEV